MTKLDDKAYHISYVSYFLGIILNEPKSLFGLMANYSPLPDIPDDSLI